MRKANKALISAVAAMTLGSVGIAMPAPAYAGHGGAIALGALGGFAAGTVLGSALAGPRYYAPPPAPVYAYPAYESVYSECVRHRVWGPYGWHWITEC